MDKIRHIGRRPRLVLVTSHSKMQGPISRMGLRAHATPVWVWWCLVGSKVLLLAGLVTLWLQSR